MVGAVSAELAGGVAEHVEAVCKNFVDAQLARQQLLALAERERFFERPAQRIDAKQQRIGFARIACIRYQRFASPQQIVDGRTASGC